MPQMPDLPATRRTALARALVLGAAFTMCLTTTPASAAASDVVATTATTATATATANAPADEALLGDTRVHDPSLWIEQGRWFVFHTGEGLQRLSSEDGRTWRRLAPVFAAGQEPHWWGELVPAHKGRDVWAPKLFKLGHRYLTLYSISTFGKNVSAIGLASADAPDAAEWRDEGPVVRSQAGDHFNAIDPDLMVAADGRLWMSYGSFWRGIQLTELDRQTLRPIGPTRTVAAHEGGIEAPTLVQRGGWTWLFVSWDFCCRGVESTYNIRVGRARSPEGPFLDREGRDLAAGGGTLVEAGGRRWKGPGHQDVFGDWLVRHAYDVHDNGLPHLRVSRLVWGEDGWPGI